MSLTERKHYRAKSSYALSFIKNTPAKNSPTKLLDIPLKTNASTLNKSSSRENLSYLKS